MEAVAMMDQWGDVTLSDRVENALRPTQVRTSRAALQTRRATLQTLYSPRSSLHPGPNPEPRIRILVGAVARRNPLRPCRKRPQAHPGPSPEPGPRARNLLSLSRLSFSRPGLNLLFFFFFTLVTGPRRSFSLKMSDAKVYEAPTECPPRNYRSPKLYSVQEYLAHKKQPPPWTLQ